MRRVLLVAALILAGGLLAWTLGRGVQLPLFDFVEYWAAGRLNAAGENPYDPEAIERLEREVGRTEPGVLMWNPPWTLPLVMPFGLLDVHAAQLLWLLIQLVSLVFSADALWLHYGGERERRWVGWLVAFTFLPSYFALTAGQISPLILLGAVAFLYAERAGRPLLAGVSTLLLAIKPHLTLLFFFALVLESSRRRSSQLLAGGLLAGIVATALAMAFNADVLAQYVHTLTTSPPAKYESPTLGQLLRLLLVDRFALQFIPPAAGLVWLGGYWLRRRPNWIWSNELPLVLLVSMLTAAYGAWPFDLVLLLVPVLAVAARPGRPWLALAVHLGINALALVLIACRVEYFWFFWMTPALLLGYLATRISSKSAGFSTSA